MEVFEHGAGRRLGTIEKGMYVNQDGTLADKKPPVSIADVLFFDSMPVRCLRTGRVLFASEEQHLPDTPDKQPMGLTLFSVDLKAPRRIEKVLTPEAEKQVGGRLDLFQVSPDETRVCIPNEDGGIMVADLATGKVIELGAEDTDIDATIPVWRSKDELCFLVVKESKLGTARRNEITLWSPSGTRCISKDWPESGERGHSTFLPLRGRPKRSRPA